MPGCERWKAFEAGAARRSSVARHRANGVDVRSARDQEFLPELRAAGCDSARRYERNSYGFTTSPLHGGLPTDRIYAEWWLKSDRVTRVLAGEAPSMQVTEHVDVPDGNFRWGMEGVPDETRPKALDVQSANAAALGVGVRTAAFRCWGTSGTQHGDGRFLLGVWDEALAY